MKLKTKLDFRTNVLKPGISAIIMGIAVYLVQYFISGILGNTIATLMAILVGVCVYGASIILMKVLEKEDLMMIPFGAKIYELLVKLHIYEEEPLA